MQGIIGAICGDIIGSTREFNPIKTKNFRLLEANSTFTDDTILTLAIAKWLTDDKNCSQKNTDKKYAGTNTSVSKCRLWWKF